jgi:ribonuclease D
MHIHPLITDTDTLQSLCERLARSPFVAVDTEFMRENTYWPDLCLIQIGNTDEAAAIDPKADGLDLAPLLELLVNNEDVLKVFHAGGQDLEIIFNASPTGPAARSTSARSIMRSATSPILPPCSPRC